MLLRKRSKIKWQQSVRQDKESSRTFRRTRSPILSPKLSSQRKRSRDILISHTCHRSRMRVLLQIVGRELLLPNFRHKAGVVIRDIIIMERPELAAGVAQRRKIGRRHQAPHKVWTFFVLRLIDWSFHTLTSLSKPSDMCVLSVATSNRCCTYMSKKVLRRGHGRRLQGYKATRLRGSSKSRLQSLLIQR